MPIFTAKPAATAKAPATGVPERSPLQRKPLVSTAGGMHGYHYSRSPVQRRVTATSGAVSAEAESAHSAPADSNAAVVQRVVQEDSSTGVTLYYSSLDPNGERYADKRVADNVDEVICEYRGLIGHANGRLADIPSEALGRLQRISPFGHSSWVPHQARVNQYVNQLHAQLLLAMQPRQIPIPPYPHATALDFATWAQLLDNDGFPQARTLLQIIQEKERLKQPHFAAGYKHQLREHMVSRANYRLTGIEVPYGVPNPETGYPSRADEENIYGFTQPTQPDYFGPSQEDRQAELVDHKVGYGDPLGVPVERLRQELKQYGGVASNPYGTYGGVEHGREDAPLVRFQWYQQPGHIHGTVGGQVHGIRREKPDAFPGGFKLGGAQILPPLPESQKQVYEKRAGRVAHLANSILLDDDVLTQAGHIPWDDYDGDFNSWVEHVISGIEHHADARQLQEMRRYKD